MVVAGSGSTGRPGSWGLEAGQEWRVDPGLKATHENLPMLHLVRRSSGFTPAARPATPPSAT